MGGSSTSGSTDTDVYKIYTDGGLLTVDVLFVGLLSARGMDKKM